jgi:hypothetical protein
MSHRTILRFSVLGAVFFAVVACGRCLAGDPSGIDRLKRALQDPNDAGRVEAIKKLKVADADGPKALELLVPLFSSDSTSEVRLAAGTVIRQLAGRAKSKLPGLVETALLEEMAKTKDWADRAAIATLFGELKLRTDTSRAALIKWMEDAQPEIRRAAFTSLIRNYPTGPKNDEYRDPVVAGFNDKDAQTRRAVAVEFAKYGKGRIDVLVKLINSDPPRWVYAEALATLGAMHPNEEHKKVFVDALRHPNTIVRERALTALEKLDPHYVANSGLLGDPDPTLRIALLNRINKSMLDKKPTEATRKSFAKLKGALLESLRDKDLLVRVAAARAARRIAPSVRFEIEPIHKDKNADVREAAVRSLEDTLSIDALKGLMDDNEPIVRNAVAAALAKRGAAAFPTLVAGVRSKNDREQQTAAKAIAATTARGNELVSIIVEAILADSLDQRELAAALLRVDPVVGARELAKKADRAALLKLIGNAAPEVRILACKALAESGADNPETTKALVGLVDRPDQDVAGRFAALRALQVLAPKEAAARLTPETVDRLVTATRARSKALRDESLANQQLDNLDDDSMETILALFATGEFNELANDLLMHRCSASEPIGTSSPSFVRALALFGAGGKRRLDPATELALKESCWRHVNETAPHRSWEPPALADAALPMTADRLIWGTSLLLVLDILKDDSDFKNRQIHGKSLDKLHRAWSAWWVEWAGKRQSVGTWSSLAHPTTQLNVWAALLNVHDFAKDNPLKQRIKMLIDISFIEDEQLSVHGDRGRRRGNSARPECGLSAWKDLLLGEPSRRLGPDTSGMRGALWTTSYEMPTPVVLLRKLQRPVANAAVKNHDADGGVTTAYVTPHYILAAHTPAHYYTGEFARAWDRLVFDDMSAVFFMERIWRNESVRLDNLMMSRAVFAPKPRRSIAFSANLKVAESKGWLFLSNGSGYAGLFIAGGHERFPGDFGEDIVYIQPRSTAAMVILQAGDKQSFGSFDEFQAAILKSPLTWTTTSLRYTGPRLPAVEFFTDWKQPSLVAGQPFSPRNETMRFDSPYLRGQVNSPQVTVRVGLYSAVYDFEKNTITPLDLGKN